MDGRRSLTFQSLDEVMPEVDRLLAGHRTLGKWTLGQICNHLTVGILGSVEGFPARAPWPFRVLLGPIIKRKVFGKGRMPDGLKLPDKYAPRPGLDDRAEAEALRAALRLFSAHDGPLARHPLIERMTDEEWRRLHCIHAAHHLGFVVPEPAGSA